MKQHSTIPPWPSAHSFRAGLLPLLLASLLICGGAARLLAQEGSVTGRILPTQSGGNGLAGTKVVLMEFQLGEGGQPHGRPLQTVEADAAGNYTFASVPVTRHAVYKLGARVNGVLVGSEAFTFPEGTDEVVLNLQVPGLTEDASGLRFREVILALEPGRGVLWVTTVLHLENPGPDTVEGLRDPMAMELPSGAESLEILRGVEDGAESRQLGQKVLFYGNLPPGVTILAYRYRLPAALGSAAVTDQFEHPVAKVTALVPEASLTLRSDMLDRRGARTFTEGQRYESWGADNLPAGTRLDLTARGIPVQQELLLLPLLGFLAAAVGLLIWFVRRRLPAESARENSAV